MKSKQFIICCVSALVCYLQATDAKCDGYLHGCFALVEHLCNDKPFPAFQKSCGKVGGQDVWVPATVINVVGTYDLLLANPPAGREDAYGTGSECTYTIAYRCYGIDKSEDVLVPSESWSLGGDYCWIG